MSGLTDMTRTGHAWRDMGDGRTVACRHCGAEPWSRDGRLLCPVTTTRTERAEQWKDHPSVQPLRPEELHKCDCGNPQCAVVYGLAVGWISALNDALEHGALPWGALIEFVEAKTREAWAERGL